MISLESESARYLPHLDEFRVVINRITCLCWYTPEEVLFHISRKHAATFAASASKLGLSEIPKQNYLGYRSIQVALNKRRIPSGLFVERRSFHDPILLDLNL
jgi:hypothetical protein